MTPAATAIAAGSGDLPVLATPRMIALMEEAACALLAAVLPDDATSVGTRIDVRHSAPSPLGVRVTARATVVSIDGARVSFDVSATHAVADASVEIGRGTHVRVVVDRARFLAGLAAP